MRVRAVPVRDEVQRFGESVVLHDGQVLHLSSIPTLVRSRASVWTDLDDLLRAVEDVVGAGPDGSGRRILAEQVRELSQIGLVEVDGDAEVPPPT